MSPDPTKENRRSKENKWVAPGVVVAAISVTVAVIGVAFNLMHPEARRWFRLKEEPAKVEVTVHPGKQEPSGAIEKTPALQPASAQLLLSFSTEKSLNDSLRSCWNNISSPDYAPGATLNSDIRGALSMSQTAVRQGDQAVTRKDSAGLGIVVQELKKYNQTLRQHRPGSRDPCP
jgi:hypothetical protein